MAFMQYFVLLLIISVTSEMVAQKICINVAQPSNCGFDVCKLLCKELFKDTLVSAECIIKNIHGPRGTNQCTCFYRC
ncbi:hypothetical protein AAZX31_16G018400 [Glycine max]|nr:hypothetical protein GLYMA_16G020150v4 [Glycine max]KAH1149549.1 hypothetical protein GYH30_043876 [Glycine max]